MRRAAGTEASLVPSCANVELQIGTACSYCDARNRRVAKAHRAERGIAQTVCAFAHAVPTRRSTAWAKSPAGLRKFVGRSWRFCLPYASAMDGGEQRNDQSQRR